MSGFGANDKFLNFSLNNRARVRLTPAGRKRYKDYYTVYRINDADSRIDPQGFFECQMWELFQIFGSQMHMGATEQMFDMNIVSVIVIVSL